MNISTDMNISTGKAVNIQQTSYKYDLSNLIEFKRVMKLIVIGLA
jgi:hypothetical protein